MLGFSPAACSQGKVLKESRCDFSDSYLLLSSLEVSISGVCSKLIHRYLSMPVSLLSSQLLLPFMCLIIHLWGGEAETKSLLYRVQLIAWVDMEQALLNRAPDSQRPLLWSLSPPFLLQGFHLHKLLKETEAYEIVMKMSEQAGLGEDK